MISIRSKMITSLVAGGVALLLAVLTPTAAPAAPIIGTCSPTKLKYNASGLDDSSTTSAFNFVNIPQAAVSFTQGGTSASCVIVRFSAVTYAAGMNAVVIRAVLDDTTTALPVDVRYSGDNGRAHSFEFIFPSVAPGHHVVRMRYKNLAVGETATVHRHNTVVQFK